MSDVTHDQNASSWLQYSVKYTPGYMPFSKYDDFNNSYSLWRFCLKTKFTSSRSYTDVKWKHDQDSAFGDYKWKHHARGIGEKPLLAAINRDFGFSTARGLSCHERPRLGNCFPPLHHRGGDRYQNYSCLLLLHILSACVWGAEAHTLQHCHLCSLLHGRALLDLQLII